MSQDKHTICLLTPDSVQVSNSERTNIMWLIQGYHLGTVCASLGLSLKDTKCSKITNLIDPTLIEMVGAPYSAYAGYCELVGSETPTMAISVIFDTTNPTSGMQEIENSIRLTGFTIHTKKEILLSDYLPDDNSACKFGVIHYTTGWNKDWITRLRDQVVAGRRATFKLVVDNTK